MSNFVRIDRPIKSENAINNLDEAVMLNLDLVATVKLSPMMGQMGKPRAASLELSSDDHVVLASFYLDTMEDGKRWVLKHLGVEL
jgi:hypothetical protein